MRTYTASPVAVRLACRNVVSCLTSAAFAGGKDGYRLSEDKGDDCGLHLGLKVWIC